MLEGFGLTDGEATERLWSYLRPFAKITKEMTATGRQELLDNALEHFTAKKNESLGMSELRRAC